MSPDWWPEFVEGLIKDMASSGGPADPRLAEIYIKESMWERLFEFVKQSPSFHTFDHYEKYLKNEYASELADVYAAAVIKYLDDEYNPGRNHYQIACRYIRRIKKLGSPERADALAADLRAKFPRRSALLEELEMI